MLNRSSGRRAPFVKHPITNGVAEGLNSQIMNIKRKAGGFRNPVELHDRHLRSLWGTRSLPTLIPEGPKTKDNDDTRLAKDD
jgi:hypothetical protein